MAVACRLVQTPGVSALPPEEQSAIREKVERFSEFTPDNDPHGEHDFGAFEHTGERIFWKSNTTTGRCPSGAKTRATRERPCAC